MSDLIEKPVTDREVEVRSLPIVLADRMTGVQAALSTLCRQVEHVGRMLTMPQTDTRDMRGGVTRQLLAQDPPIRDVAARQECLERRVAGVQESIVALKKNLSNKFEQILARLRRG